MMSAARSAADEKKYSMKHHKGKVANIDAEKSVYANKIVDKFHQPTQYNAYNGAIKYL